MLTLCQDAGYRVNGVNLQLSGYYKQWFNRENTVQ